jgi:hypothetical protein
MMKRAKLILVFILLLSGVFLLANYQIEADATDLGEAKTVYLGQDERMQVVFDGDGDFDYVCFDCTAYGIPNCSVVPPPAGEYCCYEGVSCETGWRQGQYTELSLCAGKTDDNGKLVELDACININDASMLESGFGTENWPWWPPYG